MTQDARPSLDLADIYHNTVSDEPKQDVPDYPAAPDQDPDSEPDDDQEDPVP